ncbi:MAG: epoxyqueuosine reductase QueH [Erysipelotrichaceae bacterium]|nr:epoxyqueuosine reductase QueH [Erysipelotrichaceae bacterium]
MKKDSRKYYYSLQLSEIEKIKALDHKPSLLMHTCCGICVSWPALYLSEFFDLTLYYNNDNIYPQEEYEKRYSELIRLIDSYNREKGTDIKVIKTPFNGEEYHQKLEPLKDEPENGARCHLCYALRMEPAMAYAAENHYDYFTTVMTVSRQKDSRVLNQIGERLQEKYPQVSYFFSDFKKDGGLEKGDRLASEYGIYRQNYCGCLYSYKEMLEKARKDYQKKE